jgi:acetyl esterase/lipase
MIHKTIKLWTEAPTLTSAVQDGPPSELDAAPSNRRTPTLDTYVLSGDRIRPAVLICPGGGYGYTSEREAEPIALQFNAAGFHAFVVYYSVAPYRHPQPLQDVSSAMCIIRDRAEEWRIHPQQIAVCGFSAGGHLAASLGVHWHKSYVQNVPGMEADKNRPDALILSYPVISSGPFAHQGSFENLLGPEASEALQHEMSLEQHVHDKIPPVFLWHTVEDTAVPVENSLLFAMQLRKHDMPFEMHIYPDRPHG